MSISKGNPPPFVRGEADRWFERNREAIAAISLDSDPCLRLLNLYSIHPTSVVEVGAANGYRVAHLAALYGCRAVAVEPSRAAINDGMKRYPAVEFVQAASDRIPLRSRFELAIANFVFHWVPRDLLLRSAAEVDRLLEPSGYLIIGDFLPATMLKRHYHHLPDGGLYTYKQDYSEMFVASGCYERIALLSGSHSHGIPSAEEDQQERTGVWLLRKRLDLHLESGPVSQDPGSS